MTLRSSAVRLMLLLAAVVPVALAQMPTPSAHPTAPSASVSASAFIDSEPPTDEPCSCTAAYAETDDASARPCQSADEGSPVVDNDFVDNVIAEACFLVAEQRYPILGWVRTYRDVFDARFETHAYNAVASMVGWVVEPLEEENTEDAAEDKVEETPHEKAHLVAVTESTHQCSKTSASHCPVACVGVEPGTCARLVLEQLCPPLALAHSCPYVEKQVAEFAGPCLDCTVNAGEQFLTDCLAHAATGEAHEATEETNAPPASDAAPDDETAAPPCYPDSSKNCRLQILDIFANEKEAQLPTADAAPTDETPKEESAPEECEQLNVVPTVTADDKDDDSLPICPHCPPIQECPAPSMEMTCPYLKQQQAAASRPKSDEGDAIPGVLDNLETLAKARQVMDQCEKALAAKDYTKAKECCEWVMQHCSGSRWAAEACKCQLDMHQAQAAQEAGVELCYPQNSDTTHENLKTAHHMMKKGDHYRLKGQFEKAAHYYRKVETLCPESKVAHRAAAELQLIAAMKAEKLTEEAEPPMPASEPESKDAVNPVEENVTPPSDENGLPPEEGSVFKDLLDSVEATHFGPLVRDEEVSSNEQRCAEAVEAGQRALADGKLDEAEQSAQFALGLDCDCVAAQALMKLVRDHREHACELGIHTDPGAADESPSEPSEESEPAEPATADEVVDWEMLLDSAKPENAQKNNDTEESQDVREERSAEMVAAGQRALDEGKLDDAEFAAKVALCLDSDSVAAQELLKKVCEAQKEGCDSGCHTDRGTAPASPEQSEESEAPLSESGLKHRLPPVDPQLLDGLEGIEEQSSTGNKEGEIEPVQVMPQPVELMPQPTQDGPEARTDRVYINIGYGRDTTSLLKMVTPRIIINTQEELVETPEAESPIDLRAMSKFFGVRTAAEVSDFGACFVCDQDGNTALVVNVIPFFVQLRLPVEMTTGTAH